MDGLDTERVSDDGTYLIPHVLASVIRILLFPTPSRTCDNIGELLRVTNDCLSGNPCWVCIVLLFRRLSCQYT